MNKLIERFSPFVNGWITGFDRIVFKGFILPLMIAKGAMDFCRSHGILNKEYKNWMLNQTAGLEGKLGTLFNSQLAFRFSFISGCSKRMFSPRPRKRG